MSETERQNEDGWCGLRLVERPRAGRTAKGGLRLLSAPGAAPKSEQTAQEEEELRALLRQFRSRVAARTPAGAADPDGYPPAAA